MRFCWANGLFLIIVVLLSLSSMLASCGKTGDLYLPDDESQQQTK